MLTQDGQFVLMDIRLQNGTASQKSALFNITVKRPICGRGD
jgi:hypothetical protein